MSALREAGTGRVQREDAWQESKFIQELQVQLWWFWSFNHCMSVDVGDEGDDVVPEPEILRGEEKLRRSARFHQK